MRFAPAKSAEQQSVLMLHRARELLVRQRTMVINALRGHCAELGLIVAQGASKVEELVAIIEDPGDVRLPLWHARRLALWLSSSIPLRPGSCSWRRRFWLGTDPTRRAAGLRRSPASVSSPRRRWSRRSEMARSFARGRQLSAWLGLVPRQHSSGGKDRLGRISKRGDGYIRRLLVHGARSVLRWRRAKPGTGPGWTDRLLARRPTTSCWSPWPIDSPRRLGTAQIRAYLPTDAPA